MELEIDRFLKASWKFIFSVKQGGESLHQDGRPGGMCGLLGRIKEGYERRFWLQPLDSGTLCQKICDMKVVEDISIPNLARRPTEGRRITLRAPAEASYQAKQLTLNGATASRSREFRPTNTGLWSSILFYFFPFFSVFFQVFSGFFKSRNRFLYIKIDFLIKKKIV